MRVKVFLSSVNHTRTIRRRMRVNHMIEYDLILGKGLLYILKKLKAFGSGLFFTKEGNDHIRRTGSGIFPCKVRIHNVPIITVDLGFELSMHGTSILPGPILADDKNKLVAGLISSQVIDYGGI